MKPLSLICLLLMLAACAVVPKHQPVPEQLVSRGVLNGFPDHIRFWADEAPPAFEESLHRSLKAFRLVNKGYYDKHGKYPPLHYLALSGGAYDGAFGAGLLSGWGATGKRPDFELVSGVSAGALIAPFVFVGREYDDALHEFFTKTNSEQIFITDVWRVIGGLTGGLAVTDSTPLAQKIAKSVTPELLEKIAAEYRKGRQLLIVTTNAEAQRGVVWNIGAIAACGHRDALALVHRVMLASASVPGLFAPVFIDVEIDGHTYNEIHVDGGATSQVFAYPIKLSRKLVHDFSGKGMERHLYVIRNGKITPEYQAMDPGLFALTRRSVETIIKYQGLGDLYRLYVGATRDGVKYHLATIPPEFTATSKELFDPHYMKALFEEGYRMGQQQDGWQDAPPGVVYR